MDTFIAMPKTIKEKFKQLIAWVNSGSKTEKMIKQLFILVIFFFIARHFVFIITRKNIIYSSFEFAKLYVFGITFIS